MGSIIIFHLNDLLHKRFTLICAVKTETKAELERDDECEMVNPLTMYEKYKIL